MPAALKPPATNKVRPTKPGRKERLRMTQDDSE
jgi:hypothetical protein